MVLSGIQTRAGNKKLWRGPAGQVDGFVSGRVDSNQRCSRRRIPRACAAYTKTSLGPLFQLDEAVKQIENILVMFPYLAIQGFTLDQVGLLARYDHLLQAS